MARRKSLTISIRPKGPGFEARPSVDGKQISIYRATKAEVESELVRLFQKKAKSQSGTTTLGQYIELWLEREKERAQRGVRSPNTYNTRKNNLETHVVPALGHILLSHLDRQTVSAWSERGQNLIQSPSNPKGKGTGSRAFQAAFEALRACLSEAVDEDLLESNPCAARGRRSIKPVHVQDDIEILTWEQIQTLLDVSRGEEHPVYVFYLLLLAVTTGMRQGELFSLRWKEIDLSASVVNVVTNITDPIAGSVDGRVEKDPKSKAGKRKVSIAPEVAAHMATWKRLSEGQPDSLVFPDSNGEWLQRNNFMHRRFKPLLEEAGLPEVSFHALRHTHVSVLISAGANIKSISERIGHKSVTFTLDTYGHLLPGDEERCANVFGSIIPGNGLRAVR